MRCCARRTRCWSPSTGAASSLAAARLAAQDVRVADLRRAHRGGAATRRALGLPVRVAGERGQASVLLVALLLAVVLAAILLGAVAGGVGAAGERQRAADLAALAGARAMHDAFDRLFELPGAGGLHLERSEYLALARRAAVATARRNGMRSADVAFPTLIAMPRRIGARLFGWCSGASA